MFLKVFYKIQIFMSYIYIVTSTEMGKLPKKEIISWLHTVITNQIQIIATLASQVTLTTLVYCTIPCSRLGVGGRHTCTLRCQCELVCHRKSPERLLANAIMIP